MLGLSPIVLAALTGFISGLLLSIPVGPVNLTIINEGARRGFRWALMIGCGATLMEVGYCALAFTGFSSFFDEGYVKAGMELFSFVFMLYLGVKFLGTRSVSVATIILPMRSHLEERIEERIEDKLHPHSAFMIGLVRVMANPGVLVFWIILAAHFVSREWVAPQLLSKLACIAGVAMGTGGWFIGLSWAVSLGHRRFTERTLLRMEHVSGAILLALALAHGVHIVWQMAHPGVERSGPRQHLEHGRGGDAAAGRLR
ncbi:MAG: LysE family transporter [Verrucomicrobia bacterium]|nr:LysE family transporter [Verrucomicrobiota bacterium]